MMYFIQGFIYLTILLSAKTVMSDELGYCNPHDIKEQIETNCTSCHINVFVDCPVGSKKLTKHEGNPGCEYMLQLGPGPDVHNDGCSHTCEQTVQVFNCCVGYWGSQCDECPGGHKTPCNGHGICNDTLTGTGKCTCDAGWSGYSCEFCVDPAVGGEQCKDNRFEPIYDACNNFTCPNNSRCISIDEEISCICTWPYVEHEEDSNKNASDVVCKELDICTVPPLCHINATCVASGIVHTTGIDKNCTCNDGYTGDGYQCDAIDPCQTDNGGCDMTTSTCVYVDAGKSKCECRRGYQSNVLTDECSLIDVCSAPNSSCDPKAKCQTIAPYQITCKCPDGYMGDGTSCYGNIVQTIKDLDEFDPDLKGQLTLIQGAIEKYYYPELTQHGPFTMFVPVDEGFRNIDNPDYQEWLNDAVRIRQILRQHIVVGEFMADNLTDVTFYTLQGSSAVLKVNWKDEYRFRIHGANRKGKTMKRDIVATNGVIHVINKLMINDVDVQVPDKSNIYQCLTLDRYSIFKELVDLCGMGDIYNILHNNPPVTLFVPSNTHFDMLPAELLNHLRSQCGEEVRELLLNHIFPGIIEITDLINKQTITSMLNMTNGISVSPMGQVLLNGGIEITQADMPAENGLLHAIHGLLITSTMYVYPNRCDNDTKGQGQGCCAGFHGPDCLVCPGGFTNPCNGQGNCDDGVSGSGNCTCNDLFTGFDCKSCIHNRFGDLCQGKMIKGSQKESENLDDRKRHGGEQPNRNGKNSDGTVGIQPGQLPMTDHSGDGAPRPYTPMGVKRIACNCVHGECTGTLFGDCVCEDGFTGVNCDQTETPCQSRKNFWELISYNLNTRCHIHAQCIVLNDDTHRCICKPGYQGTGDVCQEIDPCDTNRGGCHLQATCKKTGPGTSVCECNRGFKGNGYLCYMETECRGPTDCHHNARCTVTLHGQRVCRCLDGFHGNGTSCWYDDKCKINNGGCHSHAKCTHGDRFEDNVTCTCYTELDYFGDGYSCKISIMGRIKSHPKLTKFAELLKILKQTTSELDMLESGDHTVFAWTDRALGLAQIDMIEAKKGDFGTRHILTLFKAHIVQGGHSLEYLSSISAFTQLNTLLDGFSFIVAKATNTGNYSVLIRRNGKVIDVEEHDLDASNGYLNIVDEILLPVTDYRSENMTDQDIYAEWKNLTGTYNISWSMKDPTLTEYMKDNPNYSIFMAALKEKNLTAMLEKYKSFTLFVPSNEYMQNINRTVTRDFLRYYIVSDARIMWSMSDSDTLMTDLGPNHQLQTQWKRGGLFVNDVPVVKHDVFLSGGMLNLIDGLLHPMLSWCNVSYTHVEMGPCTVCAGSLYTCVDGLLPGVNGNPISCRYSERLDDKVVWKTGCQGPCVTRKVRYDCCAGHFGYKCQECPSGPETPCSGHGVCNDQVKGNGQCVCESTFVGESCDRCIAGFTGPNCNIDVSGCGYKNGGCHEDAACNRGNDDVISCQCMDGFAGNGYNCTGPCDDNNGGCHRDAICMYASQTGVKCTCRADLVGDGKVYCTSSLFSSLSSIPETRWFYKSLISLTDKALVKELNSTTVTHKYTVFVPYDDSLNTVMSEYSVLQQIVMSSDRLVLNPIDFTNVSLYTLSNQSVVVSYDPSQQMFYVNNTKILSGNIKFTNGIVHIVERAFTPPTQSSESSRSLPAGGIAGIVIGVLLLVALIAIAGFVVYRKSRMGYWTTLNKWLLKREMSSSVDNAPLHEDSEDSSRHDSGLPDTTKFDNPVYMSESQSCTIDYNAK